MNQLQTVEKAFWPPLTRVVLRAANLKIYMIAGGNHTKMYQLARSDWGRDYKPILQQC